MAHCLWHNWKLFVVASVDWCVMVLQKIYQIMLQLYSVCFCSTATRCDLFLYTCTCLWRIKLLVVFVWYLWVIVVSESLYSIQWWMTMFVAFICVCLSAADCHIYWEGPLSIMCYRCCVAAGGWICHQYSKQRLELFLVYWIENVSMSFIIFTKLHLWKMI